MPILQHSAVAPNIISDPDHRSLTLEIRVFIGNRNHSFLHLGIPNFYRLWIMYNTYIVLLGPLSFQLTPRIDQPFPSTYSEN